MRKIVLGLSVITLTAFGCNQQPSISTPPETAISLNAEQNSTIAEPELSVQNVDFSKSNAIYKFSSEIPDSWRVEYVSSIASINIYNPDKTGTTNLEKSVIFIRHFNANSFLTLKTVDIVSRSNSTVNGHAAIRYEIKNKPGVANFPSQPLWRNKQHKLIDIRYTQANPSTFYVIAYNPELPMDQFEKFIASLKFHNDTSSSLVN